MSCTGQRQLPTLVEILRCPDTLQRAAQTGEPGVEQLPVQFDEMRFAGMVEQDACGERDRSRADAKQQCQAIA